jgi:hypothetical protein
LRDRDPDCWTAAVSARPTPLYEVFAIATIDLASAGIVWSPTSRLGHPTVWAPPEMLLKRVVQCEAYD